MNAVITTSWDDGHPLDLRMAGLLAKYGLKGSFYVPTEYSEWPLMTRSQIVELDKTLAASSGPVRPSAEVRNKVLALSCDSERYLEQRFGIRWADCREDAMPDDARHQLGG